MKELSRGLATCGIWAAIAAMAVHGNMGGISVFFTAFVGLLATEAVWRKY